VCAHPKELKDVAARRCSIRVPADWTCDLKRRIYRILPPVSGLITAYVHNSCAGNEVVSLLNRHLQDLPEPTWSGMRQLQRVALRVMRKLRVVTPISVDQFVSAYTGPKRSRYINAAESLRKTPIRRSDAFISAFIKAEKTNPFSKCNPDPRLIQARSPRYNLFVGCWLKPIFRQFKTLTDPVGTRVIAKGLNMIDRASLAFEKWNKFRRPVWLKLDASRFDAHLALPKLLLLHRVWNHCVRDSEFAKVISWQTHNKGRTNGGVSYTSIGRRASGDFDTGDGNSLDMYFELSAAMEAIGIRKWAGMVDGDDVGIVVEAEEYSLLRSGVGPAFSQFGTEMVVEGVARKVHQIAQCQSTMFELAPGVWRFVRDWKKVLSFDTSGMRHWGQPTVVPSMLRTVGQGSLAMHAGIPILQEHALAMLRLGAGAKLRPDLINLDDLAARFDLECSQAFECMPNSEEVTNFARLSFEKSFGVTAEEQLIIEAQLRGWRLDSCKPRLVQSEWGIGWQDLRHPDDTEND